MTTEQIILAFQDYYGIVYTVGMGKVITRYLDNVSDELKPYLYAEVLKSHSAMYKSLPDIAIIEKTMPAAIESKKLNQPTRHLMIEDKGDLATEEQIEVFRKEMEEAFMKIRRKINANVSNDVR